MIKVRPRCVSKLPICTMLVEIVLRLELGLWDPGMCFTQQLSTLCLWHHLGPKKYRLRGASPARNTVSGILFTSQLVILPWISKQAIELLSSSSRMLMQLVFSRYTFCNQKFKWSTAQEAHWPSMLCSFYPVLPAGGNC